MHYVKLLIYASALDPTQLVKTTTYIVLGSDSQIKFSLGTPAECIMLGIISFVSFTY